MVDATCNMFPGFRSAGIIIIIILIIYTRVFQCWVLALRQGNGASQTAQMPTLDAKVDVTECEQL